MPSCSLTVGSLTRLLLLRIAICIRLTFLCLDTHDGSRFRSCLCSLGAGSCLKNELFGSCAWAVLFGGLSAAHQLCTGWAQLLQRRLLHNTLASSVATRVYKNPRMFRVGSCIYTLTSDHHVSLPYDRRSDRFHVVFVSFFY